MSFQFEWDNDKVKTKLQEHGVSFAKGITVYCDPLAQIFNDDVHSANEHREIIIGRSNRDRLLLLCLTERTSAIRIFSVPALTRKERTDYEENKGF